MEKLTLEQCNALPISELYMATIEEPMDSEASQAFMKCYPKEAKNGEELVGRAKQLIEETVNQAIDKYANTSDSEEKECMADLKDSMGDFADMLLGMVTKFTRVTVVHKMPEGTFLELNGYGNKIYGSKMVTLVEPLADYYEEGTFRFLDNPADLTDEPDIDLNNPTFNGIFIDVDSLEGFERYTAKKDEYYRQFEEDLGIT